MICLTCKTGIPEPGLTTVNGGKYFDDEITGRLLTSAEDAISKGAELEILRIQAA